MNDHDYRAEEKILKMEDEIHSKMNRARCLGGEAGMGSIGELQCFLASFLNATSLSSPGMISLSDLTWRRHNTIWSSRGSWAAMKKNLAAGVVVVGSLICSNPSETKTTRANISAATSSSKPSSTRTACLVSTGFSLNRSRRVATSVLPFFFAGQKKDDGRKREIVTLLERFKSDATKTRSEVRLEIGWYDEAAAEMFALVVFVSDGLLQIKDTTTTTPAARFFSIAV